MITIIHGDDIVSSRTHYLELRQKYPDAIEIDGSKTSITDLMQVFEGGGLFSETQNVFIEQLFTKKKPRGAGSKSEGKKNSELDQILTLLQKYDSENNIFLWEGKEIDKSSLSSLKTAVIKPFKLPQTLFLFLDSIKPENGKSLIPLFHKVLQVTEAELVFFMIIRHIRLLLAVSEQGDTDIDDVKRMAPWQKSKLEKQAALFKKDQLLDTYANLFKIEIGQKTGGLSYPLTSAIDFLLLEI